MTVLFAVVNLMAFALAVTLVTTLRAARGQGGAIHRRPVLVVAVIAAAVAVPLGAAAAVTGVSTIVRGEVRQEGSGPPGRTSTGAGDPTGTATDAIDPGTTVLADPDATVVTGPGPTVTAEPCTVGSPEDLGITTEEWEAIEERVLALIGFLCHAGKRSPDIVVVSGADSAVLIDPEGQDVGTVVIPTHDHYLWELLSNPYRGFSSPVALTCTGQQLIALRDGFGQVRALVSPVEGWVIPEGFLWGYVDIATREGSWPVPLGSIVYEGSDIGRQPTSKGPIRGSIERYSMGSGFLVEDLALCEVTS